MTKNNLDSKNFMIIISEQSNFNINLFMNKFINYLKADDSRRHNY